MVVRSDGKLAAHSLAERSPGERTVEHSPVARSPIAPGERKAPFGLRSETGYLGGVLVHRPGTEVEEMDERYPWRWICDAKPDLPRAQDEHDQMVDHLRRAGAEVYYLDEWEPKTKVPVNEWFTRDHGFMTPYGAFIAYCDFPREGEEEFVARRLVDLGIPIVARVYGEGRMEGGDVIYLDERTLLVGQSYRTNREGFRQIQRVMEGAMVDRVIPVPLHREVMHLDTVFNIAGENVAAAYRQALPEDFLDFVQRRGFEVISIPPEEYPTLASNWLCVAPGKVLFIDGEKHNIHTRKELERRGIEVIPFVMPELLKGAGGPRCMTFPLYRWREDVR